MHHIEKKVRRKKDVYLSPPYYILFNITYRCNRDCAYCSNSWLLNEVFGGAVCARKSELSTRTIKRLMCEAREIKVKLFQIAGGEPFLRDDIYELIEHGVDVGLNVVPVTKYAFTREEVQRLADMGLHYVGISLDSLSAKTNERLHKSKSIKNELSKGIEYMLECGMEPIVFPVICRQNNLQYEGFVRTLMRKGVKYIYPTIVNASPFAIDGMVKMTDESLILNQDEIVCQNLRMNYVNHKYGVGEVPWRKPPLIEGECAANRIANIHPDGSLFYCLRTPSLCFGSVRRRRLMDVWTSKKRKMFLRPPRSKFKGTDCYGCEKFDCCNKLGRCYFETLHDALFRPEKDRLCPWFIGNGVP